MSLRALLDRIERLHAMAGLERTREARALSDVALAELAAAGDEGVWQATRDTSRAEVARELGVSVAAVGKAVTRHNKRS
jgi:hypothetical protein